MLKIKKKPNPYSSSDEGFNNLKIIHFDFKELFFFPFIFKNLNGYIYIYIYIYIFESHSINKMNLTNELAHAGTVYSCTFSGKSMMISHSLSQKSVSMTFFTDLCSGKLFSY